MPFNIDLIYIPHPSFVTFFVISIDIISLLRDINAFNYRLHRRRPPAIVTIPVLNELHRD